MLVQKVSKSQGKNIDLKALSSRGGPIRVCALHILSLNKHGFTIIDHLHWLGNVLEGSSRSSSCHQQKTSHSRLLSVMMLAPGRRRSGAGSRDVPGRHRKGAATCDGLVPKCEPVLFFCIDRYKVVHLVKNTTSIMHADKRRARVWEGRGDS